MHSDGVMQLLVLVLVLLMATMALALCFAGAGAGADDGADDGANEAGSVLFSPSALTPIGPCTACPLPPSIPPQGATNTLWWGTCMCACPTSAPCCWCCCWCCCSSCCRPGATAAGTGAPATVANAAAIDPRPVAADALCIRGSCWSAEEG
eukprot:1149256-Pelagomonas_calceolata.AAC.1